MNKKIRLLMVDDEEDFLFFLKLNLEKYGRFEIMTTNQGSKVISMAKKYHPDVILLDVVMSDMHGPEIAEELLQSRTTNNIPIIFLTALAKKTEISPDDNTIGGRYFISKPVSLSNLSNCIDQVVAIRDNHMRKSA